MKLHAFLRKLAVLIVFAVTAGVAQADLSETIERVKPSIVIVGTYLRTGSPQFELRGTGFVVGDNLVATNAHVVAATREAPSGSALVIMARNTSGSEGQIRTATLVETDTAHDLALLRFDGAPMPKLDLRNSDTVREGASVAFIGFPIGGALGFSPVTHRGMVSAVTTIAPPSPNARGLNERLIRSVKSGAFPIFQLDATAYPGNSGGPLFDPTSGEVLGVINMVFIKGAKESALSQPSGISYAIPANHLRDLLRNLK